MATYYVRPDGNNANAGTGPAANQAWQTVTYALVNMVLTNGINYLYIAPGIYRETPTVTVTPSSTQTLVIQGDPSVSMFTGLSAGIVRITNFLSDSTLPSTGIVFTCSKTYVTLKNLFFSMFGYASFTSASNLVFDSCIFDSYSNSVSYPANLFVSNSSATAMNVSFTKCAFAGNYAGLLVAGATSGSAYDIGVTVRDCWFIGGQAGFRLEGQSQGVASVGNGAQISNCLFTSGVGVNVNSSNGTNLSAVQNSVFYVAPFGTGPAISANTSNRLTEDYNRISHYSTRTNVASGTNTIVGSAGMDFGYTGITGAGMVSLFAPYSGSPQIGAGIATNAPVTDFFGNAWTTNTDVSLFARTSLASTSFFTPTERNASTITIAPGSTSQSIELYLGATGLTASTAGLSAYYNRTRSADVQINLQARNITQAWTSGGFAEVNPNTMPGVYRLDIPNEALAAGADDVTVVVRGASGTNGAVMSIKLSSGGLTTAQTASAVWGALTSAHTTNGTFGWNVLRADQQSKEGLVTLHQSGGVSRVDADVHAVVNDTAAAVAFKGALLHDGTGYVDSDVVRISTSVAAANELEGALLHNGTDYIDSNLVGGNSTRVFVGRFQMTQTGTTQGDIIEAFTTDTPAFELQLFDGDNNLVPVTGATLGLRILDVASTVVETGTPTIEYGTGGIVRWTAPGTYLSIGCPAGMYRLFVDRTVSGTTTTFGPLQIKVQVQ